MKTIRFWSMMLAVLALPFVTSCGSDDNDEDNVDYAIQEYPINNETGIDTEDRVLLGVQLVNQIVSNLDSYLNTFAEDPLSSIEP